jgi:hypothetical protein
VGVILLFNIDLIILIPNTLASQKKPISEMIETKKNERTNVLREVKRLCKKFGFTAGILKGLLARGCGEK